MSNRTNRYRYGVELDPAIVREQNLYARLAVDLVFQSPQVCQLEHKGGFMLKRLFGALQDNYLTEGGPGLPFLSRDFEMEMSAADPDHTVRARIICDYLAGMTDGFATRIYKRMFDPDFGSIVDLV
jgi:dGTPase